MIDNVDSKLTVPTDRNSSSLRHLFLFPRVVHSRTIWQAILCRERMLLERSDPFHYRQSVPVAHSRENTNQPRIFSFSSNLKAESFGSSSFARARARTHARNLSFYLAILSCQTWQPPSRAALLLKKNQSVRWTTVGKVWGFVMESGSVGGCSVEKIYRESGGTGETDI